MKGRGVQSDCPKSADIWDLLGLVAGVARVEPQSSQGVRSVCFNEFMMIHI